MSGLHEICILPQGTTTCSISEVLQKASTFRFNRAHLNISQHTLPQGTTACSISEVLQKVSKFRFNRAHLNFLQHTLPQGRSVDRRFLVCSKIQKWRFKESHLNLVDFWHPRLASVIFCCRKRRGSENPPPHFAGIYGMRVFLVKIKPRTRILRDQRG